MRKLLLILSAVIFAQTVAAQTKVVPIVDMKVGGLLGGVENGKYLNAKATIEKLSDEQNYTLYLPGGKSEKLRLKKPKNSMDVCDDFYSLGYEDVDVEARHKKGGVALGDGFRWNPQPRAIKPLALDNAAYLKIMRDFLRTQKISVPISKLQQALSVDLDGDGQEEIILTATRVSRETEIKPGTRRDSFSVVLIRQIVNGKPWNIMVAGEFAPKSDAFYDGYMYEISSLADLNGDGKMELVLHGEYYEGSHTQIVELTAGKAENVENLSAACGI